MQWLALEPTDRNGLDTFLMVLLRQDSARNVGLVYLIDGVTDLDPTVRSMVQWWYGIHSVQ